MNIEFDNKVNTGQLVALVSAMVILAGTYYNTQRNVDNVRVESRAGDASLQAQVTAQSLNAKRTADILRDLEDKIDMNTESRLRHEGRDERPRE